MNIEEKAKAYDEALAIAKQVINNNCSEVEKLCLECALPELKESNDERIRKGLVQHLKELRNWKVGTMSPIKVPAHYDAWITYLEKQNDANKEYWRGYREGKQEILDKYAEIEKQKEQKPAQYDLDVLEKHITKDSISELAHTVMIRNGWDIVEKEQKPEEKPINWTELTWEDINELEEIINKVHYEFRAGIGQESFGKEVLEQFREYKGDEYLDEKQKSTNESNMHEPTLDEARKWNEAYEKGYSLGYKNGRNEQQPAEWSEEYREEDLRTRFAFYTYKDEDSVLYLSNVFVEETSRNKGFGTKILAAAEKVAETLGAIQIRLKVKQDSPANAWYRKHGYGYMAFEDGYDWLEKNLEYMKPIKSEWKPSEAEVKALEGVYLFWKGATNRTPDIRSLELLYDDLKKL